MKCTKCLRRDDDCPAMKRIKTTEARFGVTLDVKECIHYDGGSDEDIQYGCPLCVRSRGHVARRKKALGRDGD